MIVHLLFERHTEYEREWCKYPIERCKLWM